MREISKKELVASKETYTVKVTNISKNVRVIFGMLIPPNSFLKLRRPGFMWNNVDEKFFKFEVDEPAKPGKVVKGEPKPTAAEMRAKDEAAEKIEKKEKEEEKKEEVKEEAKEEPVSGDKEIKEEVKEEPKKEEKPKAKKKSTKKTKKSK